MGYTFIQMEVQCLSISNGRIVTSSYDLKYTERVGKMSKYLGLSFQIANSVVQGVNSSKSKENGWNVLTVRT